MNNLKFISFLITLSFGIFCHSQAAFDDCSDALANPLTMDGGLVCGADVGPTTSEAGECLTGWAGAGNATMWSSFVATNDSIVINYIEEPAGAEYLAVYGPNTGCQPLCTDEIAGGQQVGDPGHHILLTGLTVGATYLIQIDGAEPNGPSTTALDFCIGVAEPSANSLSSGASLLDECGTAFSETTDGGYWQSGTGTGFANLDGNAATTCGGCIAGNDVSFVINNAAWNTFCSLTAGTWEITVDNVSGCALTGGGVQAAVFTGTTGALVNQGESSPVPAGGWTSPTITVNAGECAYLMIDGFAGDVCNYDVTLTPIGGTPCTILESGFLDFNGYKNEMGTFLNWRLSSEFNLSHFIIERSFDNEEYVELGIIESKGNNLNNNDYEFSDYTSHDRQDVYYRLVSVDIYGEKEQLGYKFFKRKMDELELLTVYPNPAIQSVHVDLRNIKKSELGTIHIYNIAGVEVLEQNISLEPGTNSITLPIEYLNSGSYFVKVISTSKTWTNSFIKR